MAIDPLVAAQLDAIERQAQAGATAAANAITAAQAARDAATAVTTAAGRLRTLLDVTPPPPPPPPPPPTGTPVTIISATAERPDRTHARITAMIGGTLARATKVGGIDSGGGPWTEVPLDLSSGPNVTVTVSLPADIGTGAGNYYLHVWDAKGGAAGTGAWVTRTVPYPAARTSPPPPPPPPPPPGTDRLGFAHDQLGQPVFTVDGRPTVLLGANASGQHGYWGGGLKAAGHSGAWPAWGWNLVRLFEQDPGGGECQACPDANNPEPTADVIAEYTGRGIVVVLDYHQFDFGREYTSAVRDRMIAKWTQWANEYKDNPLVIFELANEPEATFHSYAHGASNEDEARRMCFARWHDAFAPVIDAIRATGARNLIMVDDAQAGQGCDDFFHMGPSTGSAIMARGADLVARDPLGRVVFTFHPYDAFGWSGPNEADNNCTPRFSDDERDARLIDYVKRCYAATDRPLLAGEFGWQVGESALSGNGFHWPYNGCGSRTLKAQQAVTRVGAALSLSTAEWVGFQLTTDGNNGFSAQNLTACGQDYFAYCQRLHDGPAPSPTTVAPWAPWSWSPWGTPTERRGPQGVTAFRLSRPGRNTLLG